MIRMSLRGREVYIATDVVEQVREWAAYCRSCQPGPNIADQMLKAIGDPPHDYSQSETGAEHG